MKRFSKKRQAILDLLKETKEHPDADSIYRKLKPVFPDLSLGTVYRNLKEMEEDGTIASVSVVDDRERFDGRTDPHTHAVCTECGKIIDLDEIALPKDFLLRAGKTSKFSIAYAKLQFVGICNDCKKAREKTGNNP